MYNNIFFVYRSLSCTSIIIRHNDKARYRKKNSINFMYITSLTIKRALNNAYQTSSPCSTKYILATSKHYMGS